MPKRRLILGILALGLLAAFTVVLVQPREPSYNGRTLSQWLTAFYSPPATSPTRPEAADAIRHMGTNAFPFLLARVSYHPPTWKQRLRLEINRCRLKFRLGQMIEDSDNVEYGRAREALHDLGADAYPAIPGLAKIINDPRSPQGAERAVYLLARFGTKDALPPVLVVLTNDQHPAHEAAVSSIYEFRTNARPAIPALVECLQDSNPGIAGDAANSLAILKLEPAVVVPALARAVTETLSPPTALKAILALQAFGPEARSAVPVLLQTLDDPDPSLQRAATNALRSIAPEALTNAPAR